MTSSRQRSPLRTYARLSKFLSGILEETRRRIDEAKAYLRRATELDPHNLKPRFALAQVLESEGAGAETRQLIEDILAG